MSIARTLIVAAVLGLVLAGCGWQPPARPDSSPSAAVAIAPTSAAPTRAASAGPVAPLVTIETRGGECPDGPCGSVIVIEADGRLHQLRPADAVLAQLSPELLDAIRIEIEQANFPFIESRPFTGECPVNFDGQETIYTFHTASGDERIATCEVEIDPNHPLFRAVAAALALRQP